MHCVTAPALILKVISSGPVVVYGTGTEQLIHVYMQHSCLTPKQGTWTIHIPINKPSYTITLRLSAVHTQRYFSWSTYRLPANYVEANTLITQKRGFSPYMISYHVMVRRSRNANAWWCPEYSPDASWSCSIFLLWMFSINVSYSVVFLRVIS